MDIRTALAHHQSGRLAEAVAIYQQLLQANPDDAEALHWMGSAAGQLGELDLAIQLLEKAYVLEPDRASHLLSLGAMHLARQSHEQSLACYDRAATLQPESGTAHYGKGMALQRLGHANEALAALREAVRLMPQHVQARLSLADLLRDAGALDDSARHYRAAIDAAPQSAAAHYGIGVVHYLQGNIAAARDCFEQAARCQDDFVPALYNLALAHGRMGEADAAMRRYERVLALDPEHIDARINLSALLLEAGRDADAKAQRDEAYRRKNVFVNAAPGAGKTVLILFDAGTGNMNLTHLFDTRTTTLIDWMIEYAPPGQAARLPPYDLVLNAMGDADQTGDVANQVADFLTQCGKPLLNHPEKVSRTARHRLPDLLAGIPDLVIAPVWRYPDARHWDEGLEARLPLLLRPVHTQGGIGVVRMTTPEELSQARVRQSGPVYVLPFIDYRSADSFWRKYRVIFIDREPYPYHLGISPDWMVHYYTADMGAHAWKLEEEKRFLQDPEAALGARAMRALREVGARLDLDYAGIDCSILPDGRLLVFEANPTMLVHPEKPDGPYAHKNAYVRRILDAFDAMLVRRAAGR
jgi:tetratricopeptide (TPR) repeat protein